MVRECAVAAQQDDLGGSRLVAYCVPHQSQKCSSEALRDWVAASLPEYMIPSVSSSCPLCRTLLTESGPQSFGTSGYPESPRTKPVRRPAYAGGSKASCRLRRGPAP